MDRGGGGTAETGDWRGGEAEGVRGRERDRRVWGLSTCPPLSAALR